MKVVRERQNGRAAHLPEVKAPGGEILPIQAETPEEPESDDFDENDFDDDFDDDFEEELDEELDADVEEFDEKLDEEGPDEVDEEEVEPPDDFE